MKLWGKCWSPIPEEFTLPRWKISPFHPSPAVVVIPFPRPTWPRRTRRQRHGRTWWVSTPCCTAARAVDAGSSACSSSKPWGHRSGCPQRGAVICWSHGGHQCGTLKLENLWFYWENDLEMVGFHEFSIYARSSKGSVENQGDVVWFKGFWAWDDGWMMTEVIGNTRTMYGPNMPKPKSQGFMSISTKYQAEDRNGHV